MVPFFFNQSMNFMLISIILLSLSNLGAKQIQFKATPKQRAPGQSAELENSHLKKIIECANLELPNKIPNKSLLKCAKGLFSGTLSIGDIRQQLVFLGQTESLSDLRDCDAVEIKFAYNIMQDPGPRCFDLQIYEGGKRVGFLFLDENKKIKLIRIF